MLPQFVSSPFSVKLGIIGHSECVCLLSSNAPPLNSARVVCLLLGKLAKDDCDATSSAIFLRTWFAGKSIPSSLTLLEPLLTKSNFWMLKDFESGRYPSIISIDKSLEDILTDDNFCGNSRMLCSSGDLAKAEAVRRKWPSDVVSVVLLLGFCLYFLPLATIVISWSVKRRQKREAFRSFADLNEFDAPQFPPSSSVPLVRLWLTSLEFLCGRSLGREDDVGRAPESKPWCIAFIADVIRSLLLPDELVTSSWAARCITVVVGVPVVFVLFSDWVRCLGVIEFLWPKLVPHSLECLLCCRSNCGWLVSWPRTFSHSSIRLWALVAVREVFGNSSAFDVGKFNAARGIASALPTELLFELLRDDC